MARYIDADLLEAEVFTPHIYDINRDDVIALIAEQPTADVAEVVRCKDCKQSYIRKKDGKLVCDLLYPAMSWVDQYEFCSFGERKDCMNT